MIFECGSRFFRADRQAMALCIKLGASLLRDSLSLRRAQRCSQASKFTYRNGLQRLRVLMKATEKQTVESSGKEDISDNKILQYCSIDKKKDKRSIGEMEQEFLQALQSFYYDKQPIMSNEEFDNLKEELLWEGSSVAILSSDEQRFMEASLAYAARKPILSDEEYDRLKLKLKRANSKVAIEGPRCSLRSKKVYSDCTVDYLKMTALNVPAAIISLLVVFFLDDLTGFEITYLLELPQPYAFIFTWSVVLPATFFAARFITDLIFKDALILKGPCPNCGKEINSYFGSILGVASGGTTNEVKCEQCKSLLTFDSGTRFITLEKLPGGKNNKAKSAPAQA